MCIAIFSWLLISVLPVIAQDSDLDAEIARVKKELAQVRFERERNRQEAAQDRRDFAVYQERAAARRAAMTAEADSVRRMVAEYGRRRDSLAASSGGLEAKKRQIDLLQSGFRERIIAACEAMTAEAARFPPGLSRQSVGALTFLVADCKGKNIDNVEALNRLAQILQNMEETSAAVDVSEGPSPVPGIAGTVSILRIGGVFEAVVDEKGERCAVWCGADSGGVPQWRDIDDRQTAGRVLRAVAVREGKSLPAFVELPFGVSCGAAKGGAR